MDDNRYLDPVEYFDNSLEQEFNKNAEEFINAIVKDSGIDENENKRTVEAIRKKENEINRENSKGNFWKSWRAVLYVIMGISVLVGIFFLLNGVTGEIISSVSKTISFVVMALMFVLAIGILIINILIFNKKVSISNDISSKLTDEKNELYDQANKQMKVVNSSFRTIDLKELFEKTFPLIKLDKHFNEARYEYLRKKYHLSELEKNENIVDVQSGEIKGNPFLILRKMSQTMENKVYTGTLTIFWTEEVLDSEGNWKTVTRSQVLVANVTEPAPVYTTEKYLIYANDAAPNLHFSRSESRVDLSDNNKRYQKEVDKEIVKIEKLERKSLGKNNELNLMSNNKEFEVVFNALDRDNETEFRLLFTPLAQNSMLKLLKDNKSERNNFVFSKDGTMNYLIPSHLYNTDLFFDTNSVVSYNLEDTKQMFLQTANKYFKDLYFALAPILSIPLYGQYKPHEEIYKDTYKNRTTSDWEYQTLVRRQDKNLYQNKDAATENIFEVKLENHKLGVDQVKVIANAFKAVNRVTNVMVRGRDGHMHAVPVEWVEYIPVSRETNMVVKEKRDLSLNELLKKHENITWQEFFKGIGIDINNLKFNDNLAAFITEKPLDDKNQKKIGNILDKED